MKNVGLRVFVKNNQKKLYKKTKKVLTKTCKHGILLLVREGKQKRNELTDEKNIMFK